MVSTIFLNFFFYLFKILQLILEIYFKVYNYCFATNTRVKQWLDLQNYIYTGLTMVDYGTFKLTMVLQHQP